MRKAFLAAALIGTLLMLPPAVLAEPVAIHGQIKTPFKVKHPRMYKGYRKVRHFCICVAPIVNVAGSAAQIAYTFIR